MPEKKLSHKEFLQTDKDYQKAAAVAKLNYVTVDKPGISRSKKGTSFSYTFNGKPFKNPERIAEIKKLAIPPAWTNVWICPTANGHIQATGLDMNKRKQYRYHTAWNELRNETKFHRLYEFGKTLPKLREITSKHINETGLTERKVLATVLNVMEHTYIRIGNNGYEKLYGSYGLTTLKDKHVNISKGEVHFSFNGKKGIAHAITLKNKKLARIVKECRDIPGKELFQYYDANGNRQHIDSGMVNNYIKELSGSDFSAKDFRTWAGSLHALQCFCTIGNANSDSECKKNVLQMLDTVSKKLGNTRNVCKKYYVHPGIIRLYEEKKLNGRIPKSTGKIKVSTSGLSAEEKLLMTTLKKCL